MATHGRRAPVTIGAKAGGRGPGGSAHPQPAGRPQAGQEAEESIFKLLTEGAKEIPKQPGSLSNRVLGVASRSDRKMHQNSNQVSNFINPHTNSRPAKMDYTKANRTAIKDQSAVNHVKKMSDASNSENIARGRHPVSGRRAAVAAGSNAPGTGFGGPQGPPLAKTPSFSGGRNFLKENKRGVAAYKPAPVPQEPTEREKLMGKQEYGRVPAYLKNRKAEMEQEVEDAAAAAEAAKIPPGMRMMPESERMDTLEILDKNKAAVEAKLSMLPFTVETPSQVKHKAGLEARLQEIEEAQRLFSRPNVLVHI